MSYSYSESFHYTSSDNQVVNGSYSRYDYDQDPASLFSSSSSSAAFLEPKYATTSSQYFVSSSSSSSSAAFLEPQYATTSSQYSVSSSEESNGLLSKVATDLVKLYGESAQSNQDLFRSEQNEYNNVKQISSFEEIAVSDLSSLQGSTKVEASSEAESNVYLSDVELAVLRSLVPIETNESEEITVLDERGLWLNKDEVINWKGELDLSQYVINEDAHPEIINKRSNQTLEYTQELGVRYLRPPTPPPPGEILIVQESDVLTPPAPPIIIRQQPARPESPEPLVFREVPPQPPPAVGRKIITIAGKKLPPPPRKVVIERLAPLPTKPQSVLIERWLPYEKQKRRVIYQRPPSDPVIVKPKNVIIQWEAPQVKIRKEIKYLGVIRANPAEYVQRYGVSLTATKDLPQFVLDVKLPDELSQEFSYNSANQSVYELEGDLEALKLVDLDHEGLSEYREQLQKLGILSSGVSQSSSQSFSTENKLSAGGFLASHILEGEANLKDSSSQQVDASSPYEVKYTTSSYLTSLEYLESNSSGFAKVLNRGEASYLKFLEDIEENLEANKDDAVNEEETGENKEEFDEAAETEAEAEDIEQVEELEETEEGELELAEDNLEDLVKEESYEEADKIEENFDNQFEI